MFCDKKRLIPGAQGADLKWTGHAPQQVWTDKTRQADVTEVSFMAHNQYTATYHCGSTMPTGPVSTGTPIIMELQALGSPCTETCPTPTSSSQVMFKIGLVADAVAVGSANDHSNKKPHSVYDGSKSTHQQQIQSCGNVAAAASGGGRIKMHKESPHGWFFPCRWVQVSWLDCMCISSIAVQRGW